MSIIEKWRHLSTQSAVPLQASLELTYRCNERCTHCYIDDFSDDPKRTLKLEDWILILDKLRDAGTLFLIFMGGEAMLNPHFWDIAVAAKERGFHLSLITNGLKIKTQECADRLKEVGFQVITFSLYSLDAEIHDAMTAVAGSHKKTMGAIHFALNAGIKVGINCLLTRLNIDSFFELADWCVERNIEIKEDVTVTAKFNGDLSTTKLRATPVQLERYFQLRSIKWLKGIPQKSFEREDDYACNLAKGKCAITPYGELLGCLEVRRPLGNLLSNDFSHIWNSDFAQELRNIRLSDVNGRTGDQHSGSFCDHCPGMAHHECGSYYQVTDFSKELALIKEKVANAFNV